MSPILQCDPHLSCVWNSLQFAAAQFIFTQRDSGTASEHGGDGPDGQGRMKSHLTKLHAAQIVAISHKKPISKAFN